MKSPAITDLPHRGLDLGAYQRMRSDANAQRRDAACWQCVPPMLIEQRR